MKNCQNTNMTKHKHTKLCIKKGKPLEHTYIPWKGCSAGVCVRRSVYQMHPGLSRVSGRLHLLETRPPWLRCARVKVMPLACERSPLSHAPTRSPSTTEVAYPNHWPIVWNGRQWLAESNHRTIRGSRKIIWIEFLWDLIKMQLVFKYNNCPFA